MKTSRAIRRLVAALAAAIVAVGVLAWVRSNPQPAPPPALDMAAIRQQADALEVRGRAPKTGYSRAQFGLGSGWPRTRGRCDTRDQILARDLRELEHRPVGSCNIVAGILDDPYTGGAVRLTPHDAKAVEIDHIVALGDAWQKGAQNWAPEQRARFAVDPDNLQAAAGSANAAKKDADAATWLPPNRAWRCTYAARQVQIKSRYQLWTTAAEKTQLQRLIRTC